MRVYELSPRLQSVAALVPDGAGFADVGTDHAYLPVWLVLQGKIDRAVVSDLREGPLNRARQTAAHYAVEEKLSFRLCDGLAGISPDEADTISIAGMGGETIAEILSAAPWTGQGERRLILQPMTAQEQLRAWLWDHGFRIRQEVLTREGRTIYVTLLAVPGEEGPYTPAEAWAGRQRQGMDAPLRGQYLEKLLRRAEAAAAGVVRSSKPEDAARAKELEEVAAGLRQMREEWNAWQL